MVVAIYWLFFHWTQSIETSVNYSKNDSKILFKILKELACFEWLATDQFSHYFLVLALLCLSFMYDCSCSSLYITNKITLAFLMNHSVLFFTFWKSKLWHNALVFSLKNSVLSFHWYLNWASEWEWYYYTENIRFPSCSWQLTCIGDVIDWLQT